jgi:hypothetical protein
VSRTYRLFGGSSAATGPSSSFRVPPVSRSASDETMRDMGRANAITAGHVVLVGANRYLYLDTGAGSFDPGTFDASLTGRSGIAATLAAGNQAAADVATAIASAITADGAYTASALADVVTVDASTVAFGSRGYGSSSYGIRGMQYSDGLLPATYFAAASLRACRLDPAALPASPVIVTGGRLVFGTTHTAQVTVAVYQGGTSDSDPAGATLVGVVGTTTGAATVAPNYWGTPAPFLLDPSAGRVWVAWMHDVGGVTMPFPLVGSAAGSTSDYAAVGGQGLFYTAGPSSSNAADFPATFTAVTGSFPTFSSIALSYAGASDFQNDFVVRARFGTRASASALTSSVNNTLLAGNSYNSPDLLGMSVVDAGVAYAAHVAGSNYRLSLALGGAAANDFSGANFYDIGEAGGMDTGWVTVTPSPGAVAIPASTRCWITVHHQEGTPPVSSIAYDAGAPDAFGPDNNPAAYYGGNTTESEADDGTLGGTPSTNVEFEASNPQVVPNGSPLTPNGTIYNNGNNVGVRLNYAILGAEIL